MTRLLILFSLLFIGCARKPRHLWSEQKDDPKSAVKKMELPSVRKLSVKIIDHKKNISQNMLNWFAIDKKSLPEDVKFIGYNVYRFDPHAFIMKNPLNVDPVVSTHYVDKVENSVEHAYIVRGLFSANSFLLEGPASRVVKVCA